MITIKFYTTKGNFVAIMEEKMKKGMKKLTAVILLAVMLLQTLSVIAFDLVGVMKLTILTKRF